MKSFLALCLLIAAAASYPVSADGADKPPKQQKATCDQVLSALAGAQIKMKPGSWGRVPAPLQKLPAGAEHCGAGTRGEVLIASAAFGKELEDHYAPLFAEVGCKPLKCTISSTTNCACSGSDGVAGEIFSNLGAETYTLRYTKPQKK